MSHQPKNTWRLKAKPHNRWHRSEKKAPVKNVDRFKNIEKFMYHSEYLKAANEKQQLRPEKCV